MDKNPIAAAAASFAFVQPLKVSFEIRGKELTISPLTVGEVGDFAGAIAPLVDHLPRIIGEQASAEAVLEVLTLHTADALQAVAIAARVDMGWVQSLLLDELLELATVCLEVNADFFRQALPGLQHSGARLMATFSAGLTPSLS